GTALWPFDGRSHAIREGAVPPASTPDAGPAHEMPADASTEASSRGVIRKHTAGEHLEVALGEPQNPLGHLEGDPAVGPLVLPREPVGRRRLDPLDGDPASAVVSDAIGQPRDPSRQQGKEPVEKARRRLLTLQPSLLLLSGGRFDDIGAFT